MKLCSVCGGSLRVCRYKRQTLVCGKHYDQLRHFGKILKRSKKDPNEFIEYQDYYEIVLYNNQKKEIARTKFSKHHFEKVRQYKWSLGSGGYVLSLPNGKHLLLHRLVNNTPIGKVTDHIDHNPLNNLDSNLRTCSQQENNQNNIRKGVGFDKCHNRWIAKINLNGKCIYLGSYLTEQEALMSRGVAVKKYFGKIPYNTWKKINVS